MTQLWNSFSIWMWCWSFRCLHQSGGSPPIGAFAFSSLALDRKIQSQTGVPARGNFFESRLGMVDGDAECTNLVTENESFPVRKMMLQAASDAGAPVPQAGDTVKIEYTGRLVQAPEENISINAWTTHDVSECWLKEQQGLYEILQGPFSEHSVDASVLLDEEVFTEDFLENTVGVANKIQRKKTIMAAKRLRTTIEEFPDGQIFDSSSDKNEEGTYEFTYGKGKTIRAMEALVGSMQEGERSKVICRADYGYGSEGYRTVQGEVVVPPFCGLEFEVKLLSIVNSQ